MRMKTKITSFFIPLIVLFLLCACAVHQLNSEVIAGKEYISKALFYAGFSSNIMSLQSRKSQDASDDEIIISGVYKTEILDAKSKILKRQLTPKKGYIVGFIDVNKDGIDEIIEINRGPAFRETGCGIFNNSGETIWWIEGLKVRDISIGDLDCDGDIEFYVACDRDGLIKLDYTGKKIWEHRYNHGICTDVEIFNHRDEEPLLIISVSFPSVWPRNTRLIQILDKNGNLIREFKPKKGIGASNGAIKYCPWIEPQHFFARAKYGFYIYDFKGNIVFKQSIWRYVAPMLGSNATTVKFEDSKEPYLAVLLRSQFNRSFFRKGICNSMLLIFSPDKKLVYKEVFPQILTTALCTAHFDSSGNEALLIGVGNEVWSYNLVSQKRENR